MALSTDAMRPTVDAANVVAQPSTTDWTSAFVTWSMRREPRAARTWGSMMARPRWTVDDRFSGFEPSQRCATSATVTFPAPGAIQDPRERSLSARASQSWASALVAKVPDAVWRIPSCQYDAW